jgi:ankyrin repeat protein
MAELKVDLTGRDGFGNTPATWAAAGGHVAVLRVLHQLGVHVNSEDQWGHTPATRAATRGHVHVIRELVYQSQSTDGGSISDINLQGAVTATKKGFSPATGAALKGHVQMLKELGRHGVDLSRTDAWGYTPAAVAATFGEVHAVHELGRLRADLNKPCGIDASAGRLTPAAIAAKGGHVDVLEELLMNGVDLNATEPETVLRNGKMRLPRRPEPVSDKPKTRRQVEWEKTHRLAPEEEVTPTDVARAASQHNALVFLEDVMLGKAQEKQFVRWWFDAVEDGNLASLSSLYKQMESLALQTNAAGQNAMTMAASMDKADVVQELRLLVGSGYLKQSDKRGLNAVTQAIESKALKVMQELLEQPTDLVRLPDKRGWTATTLACKIGQDAMLALLGGPTVTHGKGPLDWNQCDHRGRKPVVTACIFGHPNVLLFLQEQEVPVKFNVIDASGFSAATAAAQYDQARLVKLLGEAPFALDFESEDGRGYIPITAAAEAGSKSTLHFMASILHVDLNKLDGRGWSAASTAAHTQQRDILVFLHEWEMPADFTRSDNLGNTATTWAACLGDAKSMDLLGAVTDLNNQDGWGYAPAHWAAHTGHHAVLRAMTKARTPVNFSALNRNGNSAATIAAKGGHIAVLSELNRLDVDLNTPDGLGNTPACIAAQKGNFAMLTSLSRRGVDLSLPNGRKLTPLMISQTHNHAKLVAFLEEGGRAQAHGHAQRKLQRKQKKQLVKEQAEAEQERKEAQEHQLELERQYRAYRRLEKAEEHREFMKTDKYLVQRMEQHMREGALRLVEAAAEAEIKPRALQRFLHQSRLQLPLEKRRARKKLRQFTDGLPEEEDEYDDDEEQVVTATIEEGTEDGSSSDDSDEEGDEYEDEYEYEEYEETGEDENEESDSEGKGGEAGSKHSHHSHHSDAAKKPELPTTEEGIGSSHHKHKRTVIDPYDDDVQLLFASVRSGDVSKVKEILQAIPEYVAAVDTCGFHLCTIASWSNEVPVLRALHSISTKLPPPSWTEDRTEYLSANDRRGYTPATSAAYRGHATVLSFLREHGVDLAAQDGRGYTPATRAAVKGRVDVLRLLSENGVPLGARDGRGDTVACWAACKGHLGVLRLLHEVGVDLAALDSRGNSPATRATLWGQNEAVLLLTVLGVNIEGGDARGHTPSQLANFSS